MLLLVGEGRHFNGGTIRWAPVDPYDNSSVIVITLTQTYFWTYPMMKCDRNVPISTAGRSSQNAQVTCVADCATDGGYSSKPVDILTDCQSASAKIGLMTSERSVNVTLTSGAHFFGAYIGSAWSPLNDPTQNNLDWSILFSVDIRKRPDGLINTPPIAQVISPQYVIVNRRTNIHIKTYDSNEKDDVRCRWSHYTNGYRRRKRSDEINSFHLAYDDSFDLTRLKSIRKKRTHGSCNISCVGACNKDCYCDCPSCLGTSCTNVRCRDPICYPLNATTRTTHTTTMTSFNSIASTTIDTPGTLRSTSTYPIRQAIDECGGICYPGSVPSGTYLSNCTISFEGLIPDTWYAVAIQVRIFLLCLSIDYLTFFFIGGGLF